MDSRVGGEQPLITRRQVVDDLHVRDVTLQ
jgi:hypothetical protein